MATTLPVRTEDGARRVSPGGLWRCERADRKGVLLGVWCSFRVRGRKDWRNAGAEEAGVRVKKPHPAEVISFSVFGRVITFRVFGQVVSFRVFGGVIRFRVFGK